MAVFSKVALLRGPAFETFLGVGILKCFFGWHYYGVKFLKVFLGLALLLCPARCKEQSALLWAVPRSSPHPRSQYCYSNCIACITLHCIAMETCVSALHYKTKLTDNRLTVRAKNLYFKRQILGAKFDCI